MELLDDIKAAKEIVQALLKSKKTFRMYPETNPMYAKTIEDTNAKFRNFFDYRDELTFKIKQNEIFCDSEQIYYNSQKEDNIALFFFKDGLREITFKKGFSVKELEDFLRILTVDYDREVLDDDVVTLLWERDFQNVKYVVDEAFLTEDEDYESEAVREVKDKASDGDELTKAYEDSFNEEGVKDAVIVPLTDKDLQTVVKEMDKDAHDKTGKLITIIFEMLYQAENKSEYEDVAHFLNSIIEFSITHGDLETALHTLRKTREVIGGPFIADDARKNLDMVFSFLGFDATIKLLGELLDSGIEINEKVWDEYVAFLDKNAIQPFITILGELKSIPARKNVINALISLGRKDIQSLAKGLYDSRWYVVRNIIYILGKIGDKAAVDYLLKTVNHSDIRVRKEGIKALGELGAPGVFPALRECFNDPEVQIRTAAARALGNIRSTTAKNIILQRMTAATFVKTEFSERKEFYEVLSHWKDNDIVEFLMKTFKKKAFFKRAFNDENRACAAYCLGLMGNKDALPLLHKAKESRNKLLREYVYSAIKRIEYGQ
ncbi:MAG: HEAT repeat domain-containing protein [Nitrospirae bacterium]|nr:HEAT repeat domain-containing protein [Nitrospirota bacterium]